MECLHLPPPHSLRKEMTGTQALASVSELLRGAGKHGSWTGETKSTSPRRKGVDLELGYGADGVWLSVKGEEVLVCVMHVGYG